MAERDRHRSSRQRTILMAMDGSSHSEYAFEFFVNTIYKETDNVVIVFSVEKPKKIHRIRTNSTTSDDSASGGHQRARSSSTRSTDSRIDEVDDYVKQVFRQIEELANKHKIRHLLERLSEPPGEAIVRAAKQHNATIIITGSRGHGKVRRTIMGSVSSYVVHHSHIPVLVCKTEDEVKKLKE